MINTVSSGQCPVASKNIGASRIVQTKNFLAIGDKRFAISHTRSLSENISRAYSQSHELCPEEWENESDPIRIPHPRRYIGVSEQRANSCCYRSHSAIINTVISHLSLVISKIDTMLRNQYPVSSLKRCYDVTMLQLARQSCWAGGYEVNEA